MWNIRQSHWKLMHKWNETKKKQETAAKKGFSVQFQCLFFSILSLYLSPPIECIQLANERLFLMKQTHAHTVFHWHCSLCIRSSSCCIMQRKNYYYFFVVVLLLLLPFKQTLCAMCDMWTLWSFLRLRVWGDFCTWKKKLTKVNKQMYDKYWLEILRVLFVPVDSSLFFLCVLFTQSNTRQGYCTQNVPLVPSNFNFDTIKSSSSSNDGRIQFLSNVPFELFYMKVCLVYCFFLSIVVGKIAKLIF